MLLPYTNIGVALTAISYSSFGSADMTKPFLHYLNVLVVVQYLNNVARPVNTAAALAFVPYKTNKKSVTSALGLNF
tara:strand:+ start:285 stop:512 length:228 start_codon:yes stop_codon:yes gene_type:complete